MSDEGKRLPIYGQLATFSAKEGQLLSDEATREPAAYAVRRGDTTIVRVGYNLFEEVRFLLTAGQPAANAAIPTLGRAYRAFARVDRPGRNPAGGDTSCSKRLQLHRLSHA